MVRIITVDDIKSLIRKVTIEKFFECLIEKMKGSFNHWSEFYKIPRSASHFDFGVIELMPIWGKDYYSVKYINGHPLNPQQNKQTVVGLGILADVATGYPVLISEMTLLTALRTAATSALASEYIAKKNPKILAMIGTGAQSEFQVLAHKVALGIQKVKYFDLDPKAMKKFSSNLADYDVELEACCDVESAIDQADIITTATAVKKQAYILKNEWIKPGVAINALGGDCRGKTELDPKILHRSKIIVEFIDQTQEEGEIQNYDAKKIYAELWELTSGKKPGRISDDELMVFDSVGFALEDYAALRLVSGLAEDFHVGHMLDMVPDCRDPKNLFGLLSESSNVVSI